MDALDGSGQLHSVPTRVPAHPGRYNGQLRPNSLAAAVHYVGPYFGGHADAGSATVE